MVHEQIRLVLDDVITVEQCKEVIHIHQSESVVGYRERFSVTMLQEIIRHGSFGYLIPMVRIREVVLNLVESSLKYPVNLMVEWTGISCWHTSSSIPAHYDSNRPYLKQRHYSVVVYLNDHDTDFKGGLFHFAKTELREEETIIPKAGKMVLFSSGPENIHFVDQITHGERYTFTVWFTLDTEFQEDHTIITFLNAHIYLKTNQTSEYSNSEHNNNTTMNGESNGANSTVNNETKTTGNPSEIWDILEYKKEKFGITVSEEGDLWCSGTKIPIKLNSIAELIDLCSFYYWQTSDWRISNLINRQDPSSFQDVVELWKTHKNNLALEFWDNVKLWQDMDVLYL